MESRISGDRLIRPVTSYIGGDIVTVGGEVILTKEEFLLAYNTWVKNTDEENNE